TQNTVPGEYYNATQHTLFYTPDLNRPAFTGPYQQDITGRLTWQAAAKHKITGSYQTQQQDSGIPRLGASSALAPEATVDLIYGPNYVAQGTWTYPRTSRLLFEGGVTLFEGNPGLLRVAGVTTTDYSVTDVGLGLTYGSRNTALNSQTAYALRDHQVHNGHVNGRLSASY